MHAAAQTNSHHRKPHRKTRRNGACCSRIEIFPALSSFFDITAAGASDNCEIAEGPHRHSLSSPSLSHSLFFHNHAVITTFTWLSTFALNGRSLKDSGSNSMRSPR